MKQTIQSLKVAGVILLAGGINTFAAQPGSTYLTLDAGAAMVQDVDLSVSGFGGSADAEFDIGFRFDAAFGYYMSDALALELESGWIWNSVDKIGGSSLPSGADMDLYQVPILANAVYYFPSDSAWQPYIGGGLGGVVSFVNIDSGSDDESAEDVTFAYQLKAGVNYILSENMKLDFSYKFLGTLEQEWDFDATLESDPIFVHSFLVSITFEF